MKGEIIVITLAQYKKEQNALRNNRARVKFLYWHKRNSDVLLKDVAEKININYSTFKSYLQSNMNLSEAKLKSLEAFLYDELLKSNGKEKTTV